MAQVHCERHCGLAIHLPFIEWHPSPGLGSCERYVQHACDEAVSHLTLTPGTSVRTVYRTGYSVIGLSVISAIALVML